MPPLYCDDSQINSYTLITVPVYADFIKNFVFWELLYSGQIRGSLFATLVYHEEGIKKLFGGVAV